MHNRFFDLERHISNVKHRAHQNQTQSRQSLSQSKETRGLLGNRLLELENKLNQQYSADGKAESSEELSFGYKSSNGYQQRSHQRLLRDEREDFDHQDPEDMAIAKAMTYSIAKGGFRVQKKPRSEALENLRNAINKELTETLNIYWDKKFGTPKSTRFKGIETSFLMKLDIADLDKALKVEFQKEIRNNTLPPYYFHLKGGRALAELLLQTDKTRRDVQEFAQGQVNSDWDTQIFINPYLSAREWHQTFVRIHDVVLRKLEEFQEEFSRRFFDERNLSQGTEEMKRLAEDIVLHKIKSQPNLMKEIREASVTLEPAPSKNKATVLTYTTTHPLQLLESAQAMLNEDAENLERDIEVFYKSTQVEPKPIVFSEPLVVQAYEDIERTKAGISKELANLKKKKPATDAPAIRQHLTELKNHLEHMLAARTNFKTVLPGMKSSNFEYRQTAFEEAKEKANSMSRDLSNFSEDLKELTTKTNIGLKGVTPLASVSMNHSIREFFLFRLLVPFKGKAQLLTSSTAEDLTYRAELIDVSIPRRDTVEAFREWRHTGKLISLLNNGIPVPSYLYYISEYIQIIREAFNGVSRSPDKLKKRIKRVYMICSSNGSFNEKTLQGSLNEIKQTLLDNHQFSNAIFEENKFKQASLPLKAPILILLEQFAEAYHFQDNGELRVVFEEQFLKAYRDLDNVKWNNYLYTEVKHAGKPILKTGDLTTEEATFAKEVAIFNQLSKEFELHFKTRSPLYLIDDAKSSSEPGAENIEVVEDTAGKRITEKFLRKLYDRVEPLLDKQIAQNPRPHGQTFVPVITGSYAAFLHAEYAAQPGPTITSIDVTVYSQDKSQTRDNFQAYIRNIIESDFATELAPLVLKAERNLLLIYFKRDFVANDSVARTYAQPTKFNYKPIFAKFRFETISEENELLQFAFIRGLPVLSLRDLILEFDRKTGEIEEFGVAGRLEETSTILKKILTTYETPTFQTL